MLLYLNDKTYLGKRGHRLVEELRAARKHEYPVLMLHENDLDCGGCEFSTFFDGRTPLDLIQGGLYSALALAMYPDDFLPASAALAATALGAMEEASLRTRFVRLLRRAVPERYKQDFDRVSEEFAGHAEEGNFLTPSAFMPEPSVCCERKPRGRFFSRRSSSVPAASDAESLRSREQLMRESFGASLSSCLGDPSEKPCSIVNSIREEPIAPKAISAKGKARADGPSTEPFMAPAVRPSVDQILRSGRSELIRSGASCSSSSSETGQLSSEDELGSVEEAQARERHEKSMSEMMVESMRMMAELQRLRDEKKKEEEKLEQISDAIRQAEQVRAQALASTGDTGTSMGDTPSPLIVIGDVSSSQPPRPLQPLQGHAEADRGPAGIGNGGAPPQLLQENTQSLENPIDIQDGQPLPGCTERLGPTEATDPSMPASTHRWPAALHRARMARALQSTDSPHDRRAGPPAAATATQVTTSVDGFQAEQNGSTSRYPWLSSAPPPPESGAFGPTRLLPLPAAARPRSWPRSGPLWSDGQPLVERRAPRDAALEWLSRQEGGKSTDVQSDDLGV